MIYYNAKPPPLTSILLTLSQKSDINLRDFEVWKIENLYLWMRRQDHPWPLKRYIL